MPVLISDKSGPVNWEKFSSGGSGDVTISNRGDLSLSQPGSRAMTIMGSNGNLNTSGIPVGSPVPLPAAILLLGSGLLGLLSFGAGRRRL